MKHQPPDWEYKYGYSEILPNQLYLSGEDDVDELLYGEEESRNINGQGKFQSKPNPQIDMWIDLRDNRPSNRKVHIPSEIEYVSIPFRDGVLVEAEEHLPKAKDILSKAISDNKKVMVSCHMGRSRSSLLVMWQLSEMMDSFYDAYWKVKSSRPIIEVDKNFQPLLDKLKNQYPMQSNTF